MTKKQDALFFGYWLSVLPVDFARLSAAWRNHSHQSARSARFRSRFVYAACARLSASILPAIHERTSRNYAACFCTAAFLSSVSTCLCLHPEHVCYQRMCLLGHVPSVAQGQSAAISRLLCRSAVCTAALLFCIWVVCYGNSSVDSLLSCTPSSRFKN